MDNKIVQKERKELEEFFQKLYKKDFNDLEKITLNLSDEEKNIL